MRQNFLTFGHSNMCDRGYTNQMPALVNPNKLFVYRETDNWLSNFTSSPQTFLLNNPGYWTQAIDVIEPPGSAAGQCGALQLAFADQLASHTGNEIGLVPHAYGGCMTKYWNEWHRQTGEFGMAVQRMRWAEAMGTTSGIVCWLGENDCSTSTDSSNVSQILGNCLQAMRTTLSNLDLPIVVVKMGPQNYENLPYWNDVRQQLDWLTFSKYALVNTDDLSPLPGDVHFSTANYVTIGQRIATAMATMI